MTQKGTLLLSREDVASLLTLPEYVEIVEEAFRAYSEGRTVAPGLLHADVPDGEFHVKSGGLELARPYFCLKANAGFYRNRERFGLPNIQGMIVLYSAENGYPLALMDSIEITVNRTGAAGAVAAKHLARPESRVVTVCGCGTQGRIQLQALKEVLPVERVFAFDVDSGAARGFAAEMEGHLGMEVTVASDLPAAVGKSDVCVTCTPARNHFLKSEDVAPGTFVSAFGADSPEKGEIDPGLMASGTVVVDILEQCATVGELHHALRAGVMEEDDVHAELGEVVTGRKAGRTAEEEITVFDATGTGLQDAASAAAAYERALERRLGTFFDFFGIEEAR